MGILDPKDRVKLCRIDYLRRFLINQKNFYVGKVRRLKQFIPPDSEFADPRLLASTIQGMLLRNLELTSILSDNLNEDDLEIINFCEFVAQYFVDCEAGKLSGGEC